MTTSTVEHAPEVGLALIVIGEAATHARDNATVTRVRTTDDLLDIRNAVSYNPAATAEVDRLLASIPGAKMVDSVWIVEQLAALALLVQNA